MSRISIILRYAFAGMLIVSSALVQASENDTISHVVMVWLKDSGNTAMQKKFIEASKELNDLPGIINRHVGVVVRSDKLIVDDTFDVAVTVTLKDKKALQDYMDHPKHKQIIEEKLKPLVNRIVIYDFQ